jgi:hypothetical protein
MQQTSFFPHETLRAYQQAVQVSRWVSAVRFPRGMAWAKDQAQRAAGSVALNIAEGPRLRWSLGGRSRRGSAGRRSRAQPRTGPGGAGPAQPPYGPSPGARAFAASGFARWSEIANASASEACVARRAVQQLVDLPGAAEKQQELRALGAVRTDSMLVGLMR